MKSGFTSLGYPGSQKEVSFLESNLQSVQIGKKKVLLKEKKKKKNRLLPSGVKAV